MAYGAHLQSRGAELGDGPVQSLAYNSNVTAGSTLVAAVRLGDSPAYTPILTDTRGNTWVNLSFTNEGGVQLYFYYVLSCASSGANTVQVDTGDDNSIRVIIAEYEGSSTLNASNGGFGESTSLSSGNIVTSVATTLIVGMGSTSVANGFTPGTDFTERQEVATRVALEDRVVTSASTYTATMTIDISAEWAMVGAAFAQAGGTILTVSPAKIKWQASTSRLVYLSAMPAKMQWRAQTPTLIYTTTQGVILVPGRRLPTPRGRSPIGAAIDRNHPLNQGLLAWWLVQPWMFPGQQFYDMTGLAHGTLRGMAASTETSGWGATTRPWGRGELRFEAGDDAVALPDIAVNSALFTIALWLSPHTRDPAEYGALLADTNDRELTYNQSTLNYYEDGSHRATALLTPNTWTHVAMTTTATGVIFYFNGEPAGSVTYSTGSPQSPTFRWIGSDEEAVAFLGFLDDIRIYNRVLTATSIQELYQRSAVGNVGLLTQPKRLWAVGRQAAITPTQTVSIQPARMQWRASTPAIVGRVLASPAQMKWQAQRPTLTRPGLLPTGAITFTRGRRLLYPRSHFPGVLGANPTHPLNEGLVAWYLAQPWMFQGTQWNEIVNGYEGTLTNQAAGSIQSGWGATTRPGGRGEVRFDGENDVVVTTAIPMPSNIFSVAMWIHPLTPVANEYGTLIAESNDRELTYNQDTLNYYEFESHRATTIIQANTWTHIVLVSIGTGLAFYFNGILGGTATYDVGTPTWNFIGNDEENTMFRGYLDDIRIFARALNNREVVGLYQTSLTGAFDLLQYPRKMWILGGLHDTVRIEPARIKWRVPGVPFNAVKLIQPARMQWVAQNKNPHTVIPAIATTLVGLRRMPQPRLRYAPRIDLDHAEVERRGLLLWFLAQPWQFPGRQWVDMVHSRIGQWRNLPTGDGVTGWVAASHTGGRGALGFDGATSAITLDADAGLNNLGQLTLSLWLYPRTFGSTGKVRILDKLGIAGLGGFALGLNTVETTSRAIEWNVAGTTLLTAFSENNVIDVHTWTHLTVVWTGSMQRSQVVFYLNGTQVPTSTTAGQEGSGGPLDDSFNALTLGNRDALDRGFDGLLDDVRLYTQVLNPAEVYGLYQDSLRGAPRLLQRPRIPLTMGGFLVISPHNIVVVTPARLQWKASTPSLTVGVRATPSRMQWRAQAIIVVGTVQSNPSRVKWQAQALIMPRTFDLTPARMQWRASTLLVQAIRLVTPARMPWQAGTTNARNFAIPTLYAPSPIIHPIFRHWTRKPPVGTPIRYSTDFPAGSLVCSFLMNEGQGTTLYDGVQQRVITLGAGASDSTHTSWETASLQGWPGPVLRSYPDAGALPTSGHIDRPIFLLRQRGWAVEFWFNAFPAEGAEPLYNTLITYVSGWGGNTARLMLYKETATTGEIYWNDNFTTNQTSGVDYSLNAWHHLVVVGMGGAVGSLTSQHVYIDGQEVTSYLMANFDIAFGRLLNDAASNTFKGLIGLCRVWARPLSPQEIVRLAIDPYWMMEPPTTAFYVNRLPASPPAQMAWQAQALRANRGVLATPARMPWKAQTPSFTGVLVGGVVPSRMQWRAAVTERSINIQPARIKWRSSAQRLPVGLNLRDCGDTYEAALQKTTIGGDWLIQAPDIGLKVSFNYEAGGGWEHRIVDISDIEISAPPGGGMASAANVTVTIAENQTGQSILQLWEAASAVEAVEVTIDFILNGETSALRIFTGRIDSIVVKDALAQLLIIDDSISRNLLIPKDVVTIEDFPNADQAVLTQAIPLVYGQGSKIGAVPLLLVDVPNNTYLVANHPMTLGGKLAVYDQPTQTFLTLETIVPIFNNGTGTISLGTLNDTRLFVIDAANTINPTNAIDGNSGTFAVTQTTFAGPGYMSTILASDGWGVGRWALSAPASPRANTIKIDIINHRRSPGSDPTTTGQFIFRTVDASLPLSIEHRKFFITPAFNHVTSAQNNTFILSNVNVGVNEIFDILLITRCQGTIGNASQTYQVGEISLTPLVAFSANISGTPTAIGIPINIQELRFNPQRPTLSVYFASAVSAAAAAIDGSSTTIAQILTTGIDSNLDGIGELIVTTNVTSAQRANNTVAIDLARHRRSLASPPTVTGTFAIQTYNTNTGVLLRDNLFVTQAFRHQLNAISTSYVATAINLGAAAQLAVRVVARHEGGVGSAGAYYEVGDIGIETFYQPRGDSGEIYLFGDGYEGRADPDGTITGYIGTSPGRLLQTPDMVIASIYQQELGLNIVLPSFAVAYNFFSVNAMRFDGGVGAGWAIDRGQARDILNAMAREAASILFPTFAASWGIRPFRADLAVHQEFDATNILTEYGSEGNRAEDRNSTVQITLGNLENVYNHFEIRFKYNVGSKKYDGVWKVNKDGSNIPDSDTDKAEIEATCLTSFLRYGELEPLIINANWIADETTALRLLKHVTRYFSQQRITVQFETTFKAACLQVGDFITITDTMLPAGDNGGTFEVHTIRYMPMRGRIQLVTSRVSQIPDVTIPDPEPAVTGTARFLGSPGLKAAWDFEETSGPRTDLVTGLTVTEVNGPILGVTGKVGTAIRFVQAPAASGQALSNTQALIGAFTGTFTIAVWVRLRSLPVLNDFWGIVVNEIPTGGSEREIWFGAGNAGVLHFGCGNGNGAGLLNSTGALPFTGTSADWTLVCAWRTINAAGQGTMNIRLNNGSVETNSFTATVPAFAYERFLIGGGGYAGGVPVGGVSGNMDLDQLLIFDRVLTQGELDDIWNGGVG